MRSDDERFIAAWRRSRRVPRTQRSVMTCYPHGLSRREPLIKSTAGQIIGTIVIFAGALWYWNATGRPGPRRGYRPELFVATLAVLAVVTAWLPLIAHRRRRLVVFAICLPLAFAFGFAAIALQRATSADLSLSITLAAIFGAIIAALAIFDVLSKRRRSKPRRPPP